MGRLHWLFRWASFIYMDSDKWRIFPGCAQGEMGDRQGQRDAMMLTLKMEEGDHKPGNAGDLRKLEKTRKWILFQNLRKGSSPAHTLISAK